MEGSNTNGFFAFKMQQAREAYEEAQGLLADNAELKYVANNIFYVYYYPVLGLLHLNGSEPGMQSVSIALFEKLFSDKGIIDARFFPLIKRAFDMKPKCTETGLKHLDRADVQDLMQNAQDFCHAAEEAAVRVAKARQSADAITETRKT